MSTIEDRNYISDPRTHGPTGKPVITLTICEICAAPEDSDHTPDCECTGPVHYSQCVDEEIELPTRWEVCDVCDGRGTHVNPAIDCNGLTAEDFAEDPDFADEYRSGMYDVPCNRCGGRTTVLVVDADACAPEDLEAWRSVLNDRAAARREAAMGY